MEGRFTIKLKGTKAHHNTRWKEEGSDAGRTCAWVWMIAGLAGVLTSGKSCRRGRLVDVVSESLLTSDLSNASWL